MLSFLYSSGIRYWEVIVPKGKFRDPMCLLFYVSLEGCVVCAQTPGVPFFCTLGQMSCEKKFVRVTYFWSKY